MLAVRPLSGPVGTTIANAPPPHGLRCSSGCCLRWLRHQSPSTHPCGTWATRRAPPQVARTVLPVALGFIRQSYQLIDPSPGLRSAFVLAAGGTRRPALICLGSAGRARQPPGASRQEFRRLLELLAAV